MLTIVQAFTREGLADDVAQHLAGTAVDKMFKQAADQEDTISVATVMVTDSY